MQNENRGAAPGEPVHAQSLTGTTQASGDAVATRLKSLLREPSAEEVTGLKAQYPNATLQRLVTSKGFVAVVLTPVPEHLWQRFRRNSVGGDEKKARAVELLFRDVAVFPAASALNEALKLQPALAETFGQKVLKLAGMEEEDEIEGNAL